MHTYETDSIVKFEPFSKLQGVSYLTHFNPEPCFLSLNILCVFKDWSVFWQFTKDQAKHIPYDYF